MAQSSQRFGIGPLATDNRRHDELPDIIEGAVTYEQVADQRQRYALSAVDLEFARLVELAEHVNEQPVVGSKRIFVLLADRATKSEEADNNSHPESSQPLIKA